MRMPTFLLAAVILLSSCEYLPFSSGALEGTVTQSPDDWSEVAKTEIIQLETNPDEPYSVNLWICQVDADLYVYAGDSRAQWIENLEKNSAARLGVTGAIYELQGERIIDQELFDEFAECWNSKYGNYPRNRNANETYLVRLTTR